jgi:two-component system cell cycle sensor histidine kinase/response regulator CckA
LNALILISGAEVESFYEFRGIRKDGTMIWLQACSSLIDYNGQPAAQGVFLDITKRKKTEEALAESEEKFRKAFLTSPDAVYIGTLVEGKILEVNERFEEIFGYTRQESTGKTSLELGLWADPLDREKIVSKLRSDGKVQNLEIHGVRKNRQIFPLQISISVVQAANQQLILGVIRDISSYKQAKAALRESEATYRNLINGMCDTAWVVNFEGNFVDVNEAAVKALGYSREELLTLGLKNVDAHLSKEQAADIMNRVPAVGASVFETVHTAKDGTKIPVEISASLITFHGKRVVLGIARKITDARRLNKSSGIQSRNIRENLKRLST